MKTVTKFTLAVAMMLTLISATGAVSVASAEGPFGFYTSNEKFEAESYPLYVGAGYGGSTGFNLVDPGANYSLAYNCGNAEYITEKAVTGASSSLGPVYGEYYNCTYLLGGTVTVDATKCDWTFHIKYGNAGTADLDCDAGENLVIKRYNSNGLRCTITVPTQHNLSGVSYENTGTGSNRGVATTMYITGVENTSTATSGNGMVGCSALNGTHSDGVFQDYLVLKDRDSFFPF